MSKVFFITGASQGFGRQWTQTALEQGHKVVATARKPEQLDSLRADFGDSILTLALDVTDRSACFEAVEKTLQSFGRLDVLISNAGYGHFGCVEEISETEARSQIDTNLFGSLWIIQAALPVMRKQQSGHIIQVSSIGGVIAYPNLGIYHASKWAVEGLCESLNKEVSGFGIAITLVEPGPFTTEWSKASAIRSEPLAGYNGVRAGFKAQTQTFDRGNPAGTGDAIMKLVAMPNPPLRLMLGRMAWKVIEPAYEERIQTWKEHIALSNEAHGE